MSSLSAPRGAPRSQTDYGEDYVEQVRQQIQADDDVLNEARRRRDRVRALAERYDGALRSFPSGSLAHATVNEPVKDADSGMVLDRRSWPELGPDGAGLGPAEIVTDVARFVHRGLTAEWPAVTYTINKRAILFEFHEPLGDDEPQEDPSVDLVVGLTRQDAPGLWIPNTHAIRWDPSDPERHTELLTGNPADLRVFRARMIRLTKAIIGGDGEYAVLCSFNVEALAYYFVREVLPTHLDGLAAFLDAAAVSITAGLTPDPAEVSPPIKLPDGVSQEQAVRRLLFFASCTADAVRDRYDQQVTLIALSRLFPEQLAYAPRPAKDRLAAALAKGNAAPAVTAAFGRPLAKTTRSYGDVAR